MTSQPVSAHGADDMLQAARVYAETGNYQRAKEVLAQGLSENPNAAALLAEFSRAEYQLSNYLAAANSARAALTQNSAADLPMRIYSLALSRLCHHQQAVQMAWHTVVTHPHSPAAHLVYAIVLQAADRLNDALTAVTEALRLDPACADAHARRGLILFNLGRPAESAAAYRQALHLKPGHAAALHNLAVSQLRRWRLSGALRGFLGAAALDPALGDLVRKNVAVLIVQLTTVITRVAAVEGMLVISATLLHQIRSPTWPVRLGAGICAAVAAGILCWLLRAAPHRVLMSALRKRPVLGVRAVLGVLAVAVGMITAIGWPWVLMAFGGLLLLLGALITAGRRVLAVLAVVAGLMMVLGMPSTPRLYGGLVLLIGAGLLIAGLRSRR